MIRDRFWLLLFAFASFGLLGCATTKPPYRTELEAEMVFVAPYVYYRAGSCPGGAFSLTFFDESNQVIQTKPVILGTTVRLHTCQDDLTFGFGCSDHGDGQECEGDWPKAEASRELAHELTTVAMRGPRCPHENNCMFKGTCLRPGFTIRRLAPPDAGGFSADGRFMTEFYQVERCGVASTVSITCQRYAPFMCRTRTRD